MSEFFERRRLLLSKIDSAKFSLPCTLNPSDLLPYNSKHGYISSDSDGTFITSNYVQCANKETWVCPIFLPYNSKGKLDAGLTEWKSITFIYKVATNVDVWNISAINPFDDPIDYATVKQYKYGNIPYANAKIEITNQRSDFNERSTYSPEDNVICLNFPTIESIKNLIPIPLYFYQIIIK